jgi:hypothetical protein
MFISVLLGYVSVLSMKVGRGFANVLKRGRIHSFDSHRAVLLRACVGIFLPVTRTRFSSRMSLFVFVLAATITTLPEAVRSIAIPLTDLYNRKYSLSFRSYGFPKHRDPRCSHEHRDLCAMRSKRVAAGISAQDARS